MRDKNLNFDLIEQASTWHVLLDSDELADADRERFECWIKADSAHSAVFNLVADTWLEVGTMSHLAKLEAKPLLSVKRLVNGQRVSFIDRIQSPFMGRLKAFRPLVLVGVLILLGVTGFFITQSGVSPQGEVYETEIAEIRELVLTDGSRVTLGARSQIDVDFTETERRIKLVGGEAFFSVTKDPDRPFIVEAGDTLVRAVGTKFNVHSGLDRVTVGVIEGIVEVSKPLERDPQSGDILYQGEPATERHQLTAGQQMASVRQGPAELIRAVETNDLGSWRTGRLSYQNASVRQLIYDAERYSAITVQLDDKSIGDMTVTMSFQTQDIDQMFDALSSVLSLEIEHHKDGEITLKLPKGHR